MLGGLDDLASDIPLALIGSLFGLWFLAWVMGFLSAHVLRAVLDVLYRSIDD